MSALAEAGRVLGEAAGVDRLNVFRYDHAREAGFLLAEWSGPTVEPVSNIDPGPYTFEAYAEVWRVLMGGGVYQSPLRDKAGSNYSLNKLTDTKTDLFVPVFIEERFWGALNFDDCTEERAWQDGEVEALRAAATAVAAAVRRDELEHEKAEAVAHEREAAAEARSAELIRANEALQATVDVLRRMQDLGDFVPAVLEIVARSFGATDSAYYEHLPDELIYLRYWYHEGRVFRPDELQALNIEGCETIRRLASGFTVPRAHLGSDVRRRTRAVIIDHTTHQSVPEFHEFACRNGWAMELNVPLVVDGLADGALIIYRGAGETYSEGEVALAETLAKQLALAMQAARLAGGVREAALAREREAIAEKRAAVLEEVSLVLQRSAGQLTHTQDLSGVLGYSLQEAIRLFGADRGHVLTYDPPEATLSFVVGANAGRFHTEPEPDDPVFFRSPFPASRVPVFQYLRETRRPALLSRDGADAPPPPEMAAWIETKGVEEAVAIILMAGDEPVGLMGLLFRRATVISPEQMDLLYAIANQAALAIRMARLADEAREAAVASERRAEAERLSELLQGVLEASRALLDEPVFEVGLRRWLGRLALAVAADRAGVGLFEPDPAYALPRPVNLIEWCPPGIEPLDGAPIPRTADFDDWCKRLIDGGSIWAGYDELADPASRAYWDWTGCRSCLIVPIRVDGRAWGYQYFEFMTSRGRDGAIVAVQRTAAEGAAAAIRRDEALRAAEAERAARQAAVHEERTRLAREIHDTLAQSFTALLIQLQGATLLLDDPPPEAAEHLARAEALAREGLQEARRSVHALRPLALERDDLPASLTRLVDQMTAGTKVSGVFSLRGVPRDLQDSAKTNLYRICQEALTNAMRHADPSRVGVELTFDADGRTRLSVEDDGRGFDPQAEAPGFGLTGMRERADGLGARLEIKSGPGAGARVSVEMPAAAERWSQGEGRASVVRNVRHGGEGGV